MRNVEKAARFMLRIVCRPISAVVSAACKHAAGQTADPDVFGARVVVSGIPDRILGVGHAVCKSASAMASVISILPPLAKQRSMACIVMSVQPQAV